MAYGYIQTASNVARQLKELNRDYYGRKTFGNLYSGIELEKQQALSDLSYDYDTQIAKAYTAAFQEKSQIANSALGSGFKTQAQVDIDAALQEAFSNYKRNYLNSAATIESSAAEATSQVDELLMQEAQNYVDYEASTYQYLQQLYDRAFPGVDSDVEADANLAKMFTEDANWSKYIVKEKDAEGIESSRLMTEQELRARNYDLDAQGQGTLNKTGVDFYAQMLNQLSQEGGKYSFHDWLAKENPELYDWSQSGDMYNYTEAGTKIGTFKKMMGLKSTDDEYKFIERFGGMTEQDVKDNVQSFTSDISNIVNSGKSGDTKNALEAYGKSLTNLTDYVNKLTIPDSEKEVIVSAINKINEAISNADVKNTSDSYAWAEMAEEVKDSQQDVLAEYERGNYTGVASVALSGAIESLFTFGYGVVMDIGHAIFPKMTEAVKNLKGSDPYIDRAKGRVTSNKELVNNIEAQYLDLITLLSSYAK